MTLLPLEPLVSVVGLGPRLVSKVLLLKVSPLGLVQVLGAGLELLLYQAQVVEAPLPGRALRLAYLPGILEDACLELVDGRQPGLGYRLVLFED